MTHCAVCGISWDSNDGVHMNSAQHRCNSLVEKFVKAKKSFINDRDGIEIKCKLRDELLTKQMGTYSINCQPHEELTLSFTIDNISRNDILIVGVTLGVKSELFKLVDNNNLVFGDNATCLPSKTQVPEDILVHFKSPNIGIYSMPIIFCFTSHDNAKQTPIVRDLEVCVGDAAIKTKYLKSVYTNIEIPKADNIYYSHKINRNDLFPVPKNLKEVFGRRLKITDGMSEEIKLLTAKVGQLLKEDVSESNYVVLFHHLLWLEETHMKMCLKKYNMEGIRLTRVDRENVQIMFQVPGLAEKRPSLIRGDMVFMTAQLDTKNMFNGIIYRVETEEIGVVLCPEFFEMYEGNEMLYTYNVRFTSNRIVYERMHFALSHIMDSHRGLIFPSANPKVPHIKTITKFYNKAISRNEEQKLAVEHIVAGTSGIVPYMVFGPPGTGKTITIVEAILQVLINKPQAKILVCAETNTASDHIAVKLVAYDTKKTDNFLLRVNSFYRNWETFPKILDDYKNKPDCGYNDIMGYRIVVMTLSHAGKYSRHNAANSSGGFTHLFIDEAGQCMEPCSLIPIQGLLMKNGLLVLSGDPKQLGPVCMSNIAKTEGLGTSLMERLQNQYRHLYKTVPAINHNYITMLKKNFRCHPDILRFSNELFYDNQMEYCYTSDPVSARPILQNLKESRAIIFHGVSSMEQKEGKSPSYYNTKEIELVQMYLKELLTNHTDLGIKQSDIGIITPYYRQMCKIKNWLQHENNNYNNVEVGTVEAFQGREKRIVIITTVRANCKLLDYDAKYQLGFMVDEKRFNVALSRAKSKMIVIGHPACLTLNYHWKYFIDRCLEDNAYVGEFYEPRTIEKYERTMQKVQSLRINYRPEEQRNV